mmetsp:Transcript_41429/g.130454  ORF Transcript_41429/g.130454 Transcript_41429/m.130454 type:complete len:140 (+) Transcript_41429:795-1214(+)
MLYAYNARVAQDMTVAEESKCSSRLLVKYLCALNISTMPAHVKLVLECSKSNGWTIEPWSKSLIVDDSSSLLFTFQYDVISRSADDSYNQTNINRFTGHSFLLAPSVFRHISRPEVRPRNSPKQLHSSPSPLDLLFQAL